MHFSGLMAVLLLSAGSLACSSGSSNEPNETGASPVTTDSGTFGCDTDPRATSYAANLKKVGIGRTFQFELVSSIPAPPVRGNNAWTLRVLDMAGNPVQGATITSVNPTMPDHRHGTSIVATVTPNADGTITVSPLNLFMPGIWQVELQATAGTATDTVDFDFCIDG